MADLREFTIRFVDGPFAGRTAVVSAHLRIPPMFIYVTGDGGIVSPDLIMAADPAAHALAHTAEMYGRSDNPLEFRHFDRAEMAAHSDRLRGTTTPIPGSHPDVP